MVRVEREVEIGRRRRGWKERWRYGGDGKDGKRGGGGDIWGPGAAGLEFACARARASARARARCLGVGNCARPLLGCGQLNSCLCGQLNSCSGVCYYVALLVCACACVRAYVRACVCV